MFDRHIGSVHSECSCVQTFFLPQSNTQSELVSDKKIWEGLRELF